MITDKEISVVVQGNIEKQYIYQCIESIHRVMPNSELILSTWRSDQELTHDLECDLFVFSDDPGGPLLNKKENRLNNINRELVSTLAGVNKAKRRYILKIRSNMTVSNLKFLEIYEKEREGVYHNLLKNKILILNYYTRNPRVLPMPFCPSDWIAFGFSEDLKAYYDIPLQNIEESLWYKTHKNESTFFCDVYSLFAPEQYILISFLKKKHVQMECKNYYDIDNSRLAFCERLMSNLFIIVDLEMGSFSFLKYNPNRYFERESLISYKDWCLMKEHYEKESEPLTWQWFFYCVRKWITHIGYFYVRNNISRFMKKIRLNIVIKSILNRR